MKYKEPKLILFTTSKQADCGTGSAANYAASCVQGPEYNGGSGCTQGTTNGYACTGGTSADTYCSIGGVDDNHTGCSDGGGPTG
jgi:hypothetical protein